MRTWLWNEKRAAVLAACVFCAASAPSLLLAQEPSAPIQPEAELQVQGKLIGEDADETAEDVSGIACAPTSEAGRRCLVVNDENQSVQFAVVKGDVLAAEPADIALTQDAAPEGVVGAPPSAHNCPGGEKKFKELDLEAAAFDGSDYYVVGSHGCGRNNKAFRASSFLFFRLRPGGDGTFESVQASYRIGEILAALPRFDETFARDLGSKNGLNIEGLAVTDGRAYLGLRAPTEGENAFVVSAPVGMLFDAAVAPVANPKCAEQAKVGPEGGDVCVHPIKLAPNTGIRDLAAMPGEGILILAGPTLEQAEIPFSLHVWREPEDTATPIATLADIGSGDDRAKAEAVAPMAVNGRDLDLLVLFDKPDNGGPRRYSVTLP